MSRGRIAEATRSRLVGGRAITWLAVVTRSFYHAFWSASAPRLVESRQGEGRPRADQPDRRGFRGKPPPRAGGGRRGGGPGRGAGDLSRARAVRLPTQGSARAPGLRRRRGRIAARVGRGPRRPADRGAGRVPRAGGVRGGPRAR